MRSKVDGALVWGEERYFFFLENVAGSKGNFVYLQSNRAYTALKISTIEDLPIGGNEWLTARHTIAYGNNGIKREEIHFVSLCFFLNCAVLSGYFQNGNNHFFVEFPLFKDIFQVLTDCRNAKGNAGSSDKLTHSLRQ